MAGPCRGDCEADGIMLLGFMIGCGSTAWVQRLAVNPSVGVRRQLPLHKGAVFATQHSTSHSVIAQRGSAVWVQRHAGQYGSGGTPLDRGRGEGVE